LNRVWLLLLFDQLKLNLGKLLRFRLAKRLDPPIFREKQSSDFAIAFAGIHSGKELTAGAYRPIEPVCVVVSKDLREVI